MSTPESGRESLEERRRRIKEMDADNVSDDPGQLATRAIAKLSFVDQLQRKGRCDEAVEYVESAIKDSKQAKKVLNYQRAHHTFNDGTGVVVKLNGVPMDYEGSYKGGPNITLSASYQDGDLVALVSWENEEWEVGAKHFDESGEVIAQIPCKQSVRTPDGDTILFAPEDDTSKYDFEVEVIKVGDTTDTDYGFYIPDHLVDHIVSEEEADGYIHVGLDTEYHVTGGYWLPVSNEVVETDEPPNGQLIRYPEDPGKDPVVVGHDDLPERVKAALSETKTTSSSTEFPGNE